MGWEGTTKTSSIPYINISEAKERGNKDMRARRGRETKYKDTWFRLSYKSFVQYPSGPSSVTQPYAMNPMIVVILEIEL